MAPAALGRYKAILDGTETAKYLLAKSSTVSADLSAPAEDLWAAHRRCTETIDRDGDVSVLDLKVELASRLRSPCMTCERRCGARRALGEAGHCGVLGARVASEFLHIGEEPDLVPSYTVFFSGCTFDCAYCQNWDISTRPGAGVEVPPERMARMIEERAGDASGHGHGMTRGGRARNVNWVGGDPTPDLLYVLQTLRECEADLPQVWNSNMYLTVEAMALLDGVVDVYLTDFKYGNDECAMRLSDAPDYMRVVTRNHLTARGQAEMIVRHLVLPGHVECCTRPALTWISEYLKDVKVNVMGQYRPEHRAREHTELSRGLLASEYREALRIADDLGLEPAD